MEASTKDLRFRTKEILDSAERGEEVIITYRGKPKARVVSYTRRESRSAQRRDRISLCGLWKDNSATGDVEEFIDQLRGARFRSP